MASAVWADPGRSILWQPLPGRSGSRFSDVRCGEQREPHRSRLFYEFAIDAFIVPYRIRASHVMV